MDIKHSIERIKQFINKESIEVAAAKVMLNEYKFCEVQLAQIDRKTLHENWSCIKTEENFPHLNDSRLNYALELSNQVCELEQYEKRLNVVSLNIRAFDHFIRTQSRTEILGELSNEPWIVQHEILTRWAWMCSQKNEMQDNKKFSHPYLCLVGPRRGRQNLDREFETFRLFLPHYNKSTGKEYILYRKIGRQEEPPDFEATERDGNQLGIEITEATLSESSSKEEKEKEILFDKLEKDFSHMYCWLWIKGHPGWTSLLQKYAALKESIANLMLGRDSLLSGNVDNVRIVELGLTVSIAKSSYRFKVADASGAEFYGDIIEQQVTNSIVRAVFKKTNLTSRRSKVLPCVLAIYENTGLPMVSYALTAEFVNRVLDKSTWLNFFKEIWLVDDQKAICLVSR